MRVIMLAVCMVILTPRQLEAKSAHHRSTYCTCASPKLHPRLGRISPLEAATKNVTCSRHRQAARSLGQRYRTKTADGILARHRRASRGKASSRTTLAEPTPAMAL
jgi:hypothetical protein